jgi:hypothetical protein
MNINENYILGNLLDHETSPKYALQTIAQLCVNVCREVSPRALIMDAFLFLPLSHSYVFENHIKDLKMGAKTFPNLI